MLDNTIDLNIPLKTAVDIDEAVEHLTKSMQESAWYATPAINRNTNLEEVPALLRGKITKNARSESCGKQPELLNTKPN
jgi:hypothetical protein